MHNDVARAIEEVEAMGIYRDDPSFDMAVLARMQASAARKKKAPPPEGSGASD